MATAPHVALCFSNFGPYHRVRLEACAAAEMHVTGVQLAGSQSEYAWHSQAAPGVITVSQGDLERTRAPAWPGLVATAFRELNPDLCAVAGYSHPGMLAVIDWCLARRKPIALMSDSRFEDEPRHGWKEWVKSRIVRLCAAGLAAGTPHVAYLKSLGMPEEKTFTGYDVVDNGYFGHKAQEVRGESSVVRGRYGLPECYFLASARFVEKKNLPRMLQAFALYRRMSEARGQKAEGITPTSDLRSRSSELWGLVLLGDGPLRSDLCRLISDLQLQHSVLLPGFKQYPDLPTYYGLAGAFIHASTTEQWGLVVNEAMASGLPVLVSNRCGCAADLVREGVNGFTFDPYDVEALAQLMLKISTFSFQLSSFGAESARIISQWGPERFASGLKVAAECALRVGPKRAGWFDQLLLRLLISRR